MSPTNKLPDKKEFKPLHTKEKKEEHAFEMDGSGGKGGEDSDVSGIAIMMGSRKEIYHVCRPQGPFMDTCLHSAQQELLAPSTSSCACGGQNSVQIIVATKRSEILIT